MRNDGEALMQKCEKTDMNFKVSCLMCAPSTVQSEM